MSLVIEPQQALLQMDKLIVTGQNLHLLVGNSYERDLRASQWFMDLHSFFTSSYDSHTTLFQVLGNYSRLKEIEKMKKQAEEKSGVRLLLGMDIERVLNNLIEEYSKIEMERFHTSISNSKKSSKKRAVTIGVVQKRVAGSLHIVKQESDRYFFQDKEGRIGTRSLRDGPRAFAKAFFKYASDGKLKLEDLNQELEPKTTLTELQASSKNPLRRINRRFDHYGRSYRLKAKADDKGNAYVWIE